MAEGNPVWSLTESYYNTTFIWCMLHNFGGNNGIWGNFSSVFRIPEQIKMSGNSIVGSGATPEGIFQNFAMYGILNEQSFESPINTDLKTWVSNYSKRRYGAYNSIILENAWLDLWKGGYSRDASINEHQKDLIQDIPISEPASGWDRINEKFILQDYNIPKLKSAWKLFCSKLYNEDRK
eukprot:UN31029